MNNRDKERGHHFLRILDEGKLFTDDVLRENAALRLLNLRLQEELREREAQLTRSPSFDYERSLTELRRQRDEAHEKLAGLRARLEEVETQNREFADRHEHIERQSGHLASLYVTTYNLHATLALDAVVRCVREIVVNLIGSEMFGLYVLNKEANALVLLAHEGLDGAEPSRLTNAGVVAEALRTAQAVAIDVDPDAHDGSPIACAPLFVDGQVLGLIAIYELLGHKRRFETIDRELLDVLAGHAATAVYSARLHARTRLTLATRDEFVRLMPATQQS